MFGLFSEVGPYSLNSALELEPRKTTWRTDTNALIAIDNPPGTGYSYVGEHGQYCEDFACYGRSLYSFMQQFYKAFPEAKDWDLFITGESYAGHYISSFGAHIDTMNKAKLPDTVHVPLRGVSIGDGWIDPINQMPMYPALLQAQGLANNVQRQFWQEQCDQAIKAMQEGRYLDSFTIWDLLLNGDLHNGQTYYHNTTGMTDYDNFLRTDAPVSFGYFSQYMTQPSVRKALGVGNATFHSGLEVEKHLLTDFMVTLLPEFIQILESEANYRVLVYSGNLDVR